tara:strand:- start:205 stop:888 length:684 start_codon:yes stop_codon:yes gene_type:complete
MSIHQFIFNHHKKQTENNPSSMAIFEKKLRSIASTIKDDFIKKYVLEYFLEKIAKLTPHSNKNRQRYYVKNTKSLESTKKYLKDVQSVSGVELKEFSFLYLVLHNLPLLKANIHLIEDIKFFTETNKLILSVIIKKLKLEGQITIEDLSLDDQILNKINKFAPIKHILKNKPNDENQIIELLDDISKDLFNFDLEFRIQELESKFSKDMSETTFNKLKELKNERKIN